MSDFATFFRYVVMPLDFQELEIITQMLIVN